MVIGDVCNRGEIKVTGIGEITAEPDCCRAEVSVYSRKSTWTAAAASARKRAEYARQEINNRHLKKCNVVEHYDSVLENEFVTVLYKFEITTSDIPGIKSLLGHLKSKLSTYVELEAVQFFFSKKKLFEIRKEAVTQAVSDAKHKAEMIASAFGQRIQGLINVIETECDSSHEQQVTTSRSNYSHVQNNDRRQLKQLNSNHQNNNNNNNDDDGAFNVNQSYYQPFDWNECLRTAQRQIRIKLHVVCALSDFNN